MTGGFVRPEPRAVAESPSTRGASVRARRRRTVRRAVYGVLMEHVEVRRSRRRRRSVTAFREGDTVVVSIPARFTRAEEHEWVALMTRRLAEKERRRRPSDEALLARATALSGSYLGGLAVPSSVRWVSNQRTRWGSCTPADGSIRISDRVKGAPEYVLDYVLLHELAHLLEAGHGPAFWRLLEAYPRTERARGYLEGLSAGRDLTAPEEADDVVDPDEDHGEDHGGADHDGVEAVAEEG